MALPKDDLAKKVIEHSVDGVLVIDAEGVVQFANPAAVSLFAGRTKELVGFHLGAPAIHEPVELVLPGGDRARYVEMRSTEINWENGTATLAGLRDISDRKRAEEALQRQAEELRERNGALISFNRVAVGRELRMIELKQEVNELCRQLGEAPRHGIAVDEPVKPASTKAEG